MKAYFSHRNLLFLGCFFLLALLKFWTNQGPLQTGIDGGYYTEIAMNFRDGKGLVTHSSLYHHGYSYFPHTTSVYPLWPMVYGWALKAGDVLWIGKWLPTFFYLLALFFAYLWAFRIFPRELFPDLLPGFHSGHALLLFLGTQYEFLFSTSRPYTEGLTYALTFAAFWRFISLWKSPNWLSGLEMGTWLAFITLARGQLLIAAISALIVFLWTVATFSNRKQYIKMAIACGVSFSIPLGIWYQSQAKHLHRPGISSLVVFDQAQATALLAPMKNAKKTKGVWNFLQDRAQGFPVAFQLYKNGAYTRSFYLLPFGFLVTLLLLVWLALKKLRWKFVLKSIEFWKQPENLSLMFLLGFSIGAFLQIHSIHLVYFTSWYFASRQNIVFIFPFFLAWVFLAHYPKPPFRWIAITVLCASTWLGFLNAEYLSQAGRKKTDRRKLIYDQQNLSNFLLQLKKKEKRVVAIINEHDPQIIAWKTRGVSFHWIYNQTTFQEIQTLLNHFHADYLVVRKHFERWSLKIPHRILRKDFVLLKSVDGFNVYRYKNRQLCGHSATNTSKKSYSTEDWKELQKAYQPHPQYPSFYGKAYSFTSHVPFRSNFRAFKDGTYCFYSSSLLIKGKLWVDGKRIHQPLLSLSKGEHSILFEGGGEYFDLLYLPHSSRKQTREKQSVKQK